MSSTISWSLLKLMSIQLVMPSNRLILCYLLLLLPSIFPSIRVFSNESVLCIRWPKYWSFSISRFNIQDRFPLVLTGLISLQCKGLSWVSSNIAVQKHQFLSAVSLWSSSHIHTDCWKNHSFDYMEFHFIYKHICTHTYVRKRFWKEI